MMMAEDTKPEEFVIPKDALAGYECKEGDKITLEVTGMDDEGVSVKLVGKEKTKEPSMLDDQELDDAFEKGM